MELMKKGRPVTPEYLDVKEWLENEAEPGGPVYVFAENMTADEANRVMRALGASLRTQGVELEEGLKYSIRRSQTAKKGVQVVVFVTQEPSEVSGPKRMPQGRR